MAVQMATGYVGDRRRIYSVLKSLRPDLVHAWGSEDVYGLAGAASGIENRVFTLQGCLTEYKRLLGGNLFFRLQTLYERPMVNRYQRGTAETPAARDLLQALNPRMDIDLVDYGVNSEFFDAKWSPADQPVVAFVGSITQRKGIIDLIAVAKSQALADVRFKILGDGELRSSLEVDSSSNVEWLGRCNRATVIEHLSTAWGLVIPTYSDTGPTVIKEARVVGLPIITTTGAGAACYVEAGACGFVGVPGDRDFLSAALLKLSKSRDAAVEMGGSNHASQRIQLHPETTARRFGSLYRAEILKRKQPL